MSKGQVPQFPYLKKPMKYDPRLAWAEILLQLPIILQKIGKVLCHDVFKQSESEVDPKKI